MLGNVRLNIKPQLWKIAYIFKFSKTHILLISFVSLIYNYKNKNGWNAFHCFVKKRLF